MFTNNSKKKAIVWFVILIIFAITITMINQIVQGLELRGINVYPEVPQFIRVGVFILTCAIFYFIPLLRTHHYARKAEIKWLMTISKVLLIHFYCVLGIAVIFIVISFFQLL